MRPIFLSVIILLSACQVSAEKPALTLNPNPIAYRGWNYLAAKLISDGVAVETVSSIFMHPKMPPVGFIPFKIKPKETAAMYRGFDSKPLLKLARKFLAEHKASFDAAEKKFNVDRSVVAAIFLVESHLGKNTGKHLVINRISRVASVANPVNIQANFTKLSKEDPSVKYKDVEERALYLEEHFYPEVLALLKIAELHKLDLMELFGSYAGAFGYPQFLPSTFLKFGVDGNGDGKISLFDYADAIHSTANYLTHSGWKDSASQKEKEAVIWKYNHSTPYIKTVLAIAKALETK